MIHLIGPRIWAESIVHEMKLNYGQFDVIEDPDKLRGFRGGIAILSPEVQRHHMKYNQWLAHLAERQFTVLEDINLRPACKRTSDSVPNFKP